MNKRATIIAFIVAWAILGWSPAYGDVIFPRWLSKALGDSLYVNRAGDDMVGALTLADGTAAAPSLGFSSDSDGTGTGVFRSAANVLGITTNGVERWVFNASGGFNCVTDGGCVVGNGAADPATVSVKTGVDYRGATSGTIRVIATAVAGANTITLPAATDTLVGQATTDTLTNKILTAPTMADFTNAAHDHADADDGGTLPASAIGSGTLATARGGTNLDTSASTGVPRVEAGTWTADAGISHLAGSTSASLSTVLSDETGGSGVAVFSSSPSITSPTLSAATVTATVTSYNGVTTAGFGLAPIVADVNRVGQTGSVGTTNLVGSAPLGMYQVCWVQQITVAATTSSSLVTTLGWNNAGAKTSTYWVDYSAGTTGTSADASNTVNSERGNCIQIKAAAATNITYATTYASTGGTAMQYNLRIVVQRLQ